MESRITFIHSLIYLLLQMVWSSRHCEITVSISIAIHAQRFLFVFFVLFFRTVEKISYFTDVVVVKHEAKVFWITEFASSYSLNRFCPIHYFHKPVTARIAFWEPVGQERSAHGFYFPLIPTLHNAASRRDEAL